jgi:hypothetical protein
VAPFAHEGGSACQRSRDVRWRALELFERFIEANLPAPKHVEKLHNKLMEYVGDPDPAFVVRSVRGLERGTVYRTSYGDRLVPSDNAPAWWMHFVTFNQLTDVDVAEMPTRMFDVRCTPTSIRQGGTSHTFLTSRMGTRTGGTGHAKSCFAGSFETFTRATVSISPTSSDSAMAAMQA